jgi:imidazolonepropionase-like amidohydrolase
LPRLRIRADALFDGDTTRKDGPFLIEIENGAITAVRACAPGAAGDIEAAFVMPGLTEAHAHMFLDGSELDNTVRATFLSAEPSQMIATARDNALKSVRAGVTLVRDAGDKYGVNHEIRRQLRESAKLPVEVRSPGLGLKRPKRYGGFMALDIESAGDIAPAVADLARQSDDIKIILTGVIDFKTGTVKGAPQFDAEELRLIVAEAQSCGLKTFAHCSGVTGLETAVEGGVDSIEHGFFMTRDILARMADKGIAWVPTFSPVHFQWAWPEIVGWDANTVSNLRRILDGHLEHVAIAHELGVALVAGSDAGSPGVDHGSALIDELFHFLEAGLPLEAVLRSATSRPRALWGMPSANIQPGNGANLVAYASSPQGNPEALRQPLAVVRGDIQFSNVIRAS